MISVHGADVTTIEGVDNGGKLSLLQEAFVSQGAAQCGICSPGLIISAKALLDSEPVPSRARIREALAGNLCRCTGYQKIIDAVEMAAKAAVGGAK